MQDRGCAARPLYYDCPSCWEPTREKGYMLLFNNLCSACVMHVRGRSRKKEFFIPPYMYCCGWKRFWLSHSIGWMSERRRKKEKKISHHHERNHCASRALFTTFTVLFFCCTYYIKRSWERGKKMVNCRNSRPQPTWLKGTGWWHHEERVTI